MALIGIYSDVHISHSSSILPTYVDDSTYTTRLNMCKESIKWAYKEFEKRKVDVVVNCGDLYNSHTISSDELDTYISIISDIYKPNNQLSWEPNLDITIPGNHDKFNNAFNSLAMLNLTNYSQLVNEYMYFTLSNYDCYAIAFYDAKEFVDKVLEMLEQYPRKHSKAILFMHGDINGSMLSGTKRIENHIGTDFLTKYFDVVINGHIHCHELIYQQNDKRIYNIGSLTSHSFADSNNHNPACWIFDTETGIIEQVNNPHAIVFKSYVINNNDEVAVMLNDINFDNGYSKVILKVKCPFDMKEQVEKVISHTSKIMKCKFVFTYNTEIKSDSKTNEVSVVSTSNDIKDDFITFLTDRTDLKGNIDEYINVIQ